MVVIGNAGDGFHLSLAARGLHLQVRNVTVTDWPAGTRSSISQSRM
jgi:hypothetical protein